MVDLSKFIYSETATNFCKISIVDLSYVVMVKSTVEILQNYVAFSEYMEFISKRRLRISKSNFYLPPLNLITLFTYLQFQGIYELHSVDPESLSICRALTRKDLLDL